MLRFLRRKPGDCSRAVAYLKPQVPEDAPGPVVEMTGEGEPIIHEAAPDLLGVYLVEEGSQFRYVQRRDLTRERVSEVELHAFGLANLDTLAAERLEIRAIGPIFAVLLDGNFEASLLLSEQFWSKTAPSCVAGPYAATVPARDVLAFGPLADPEALAGLTAVVERVWPGGDHLLTRSLYKQAPTGWAKLSPPAG